MSRNMLPTPSASTAAIVVGAGVLIWLAQLLGFFDAPNAVLYDRLVQIRSAQFEQESEVTIVYASDQCRSDAATLRKLLEELVGLGATDLACAFPPIELPGWRGPSPIFGVVLERDSANPQTAENLSLEFDDRSNVGVISLPPTSDGRYRRQSMFVDVGRKRIRSFERLVAEQRLRAAFSSDDPFLVQFVGGPGSTPHFTADQVLSGNALEELIADRLILIGFRATPQYLGLKTPTTRVDDLMSPLEFHAHAINTLLRDQTAIASPTLMFALVLIFCLIMVSIGAGSPIRNHAAICFLLCVISLGWCTICFFGCKLWIPWTPLLLANLVSSFIVTRHDLLGLLEHLGTVSMDASSRVRRRRWATNIGTKENPWDELSTLVQQVLPQCRMVFLQPAKGPYLSCAHYVGCIAEDIQELRRSMNSAPFAHAIAESEPFLIADRSFFKDSKGENYLVPLVVSGQVVGMWAIEWPADTEDSVDELTEVANQLAELLNRREGRTNSRASWLISPRTDVQIPLEINKSATLLESRLQKLETIFRELEDASAIFDPFGSLLTINERMSSRLQAEGLSLAECSLASCVALVSGQNESLCRKWLRSVLLEHKTISFNLISTHPATLRIRPLLSPQTSFVLGDRVQVETPVFGVDAVQVVFAEADRCDMIDALSTVVEQEFELEKTK